jgi:hypothetical protein
MKSRRNGGLNRNRAEISDSIREPWPLNTLEVSYAQNAKALGGLYDAANGGIK